MPGWEIVKRPVAMLPAKESGIGASAPSGMRRTPNTPRPMLCSVKSKAQRTRPKADSRFVQGVLGAYYPWGMLKR